MKTILFAQSADPTKKSTIVIDGLIYESDSGNDYLQSNFDFLMNCDKWKNVYKNRIKFCKYFSSFSPQLEVKKSPQGYFIKSTFNSLDIGGRKIMFMFYCESSNIEEVCNELRKISMSIGRELNNDEIRFLSSQKKTKIVTILAITLLILTTATIIHTISN